MLFGSHGVIEIMVMANASCVRAAKNISGDRSTTFLNHAAVVSLSYFRE